MCASNLFRLVCFVNLSTFETMYFELFPRTTQRIPAIEKKRQHQHEARLMIALKQLHAAVPPRYLTAGKVT